uniref:Uncharacterized protein n=1 Tax=Plectus sambesii TaxID=2011161 RepID=A0A914XMN7_9BILA
MSLVSGNLIVPTILWGRRAPSHRACCVRCLPDGQTILTGTVDGQIIIWRLDNGLLKPKYMLFGHSRPISCLCPTGVDSLTTRFVSTSDDGKMCLWESVDGRCIDSVTTVNVHRYIYAHPLRSSAILTQLRLFCVGDYPEIIVMDPQDLTVLFTLSSRVEPDWVS